jgi:WD40 repeat protein
VFDVDFGDSDDTVAGGLDDGTARVWDAGRTDLWKVPRSGGGIDFNADGTLLLSNSIAGPISVWTADGEKLVNRLPISSSGISSKFSPAADVVLVADENSPDLRLWNIDEDKAPVLFRAPKASGVSTARFDSRGERVVYADTDGRVAVRSVQPPGAEVTLEGGPKEIYDARFSPDGKRVAVISESGVSAIWRVDRPDRPERLLKGHEGHEDGLNFAADGRVATAGSDRTIRVWPAHDGKAVVMTGHTRGATDAAFSRDGSKVLSSSFDGTLRLWNSRTGVELAVLEKGPRPFYAMTMSGDGKIALLDADSFLRVFRCEVCGSLAQVEAHARALKP